jgi:hypothetical protein
VSQKDRHPVVALVAPRADHRTVTLASKPDRGTDGQFLEENVKEFDILTDSELQLGRWWTRTG